MGKNLAATTVTNTSAMRLQQGMARNFILRAAIACLVATTVLYPATPLRAQDAGAQAEGILPTDPLAGRTVFSE